MFNGFIFKKLNKNIKDRKSAGGRLGSTSLSAQPFQPYLS